MIEDKNKKRNKIAKIVGITLGIILLLGISYALFRMTVNGKKVNKITTGKFSLMITDLNDNPQYTLDDTYKNDLTEAINIEKAVPISDEEGKIQEEKYEFKLVNDGTISARYELSLEDLDIEVDEERLSSSLVKYSLIKDGTEKIGTLDNRVIDSGLIGRGKEKVYTLRIWIKEEATREEAEDKVFSAHLKLDGEQFNGEVNQYGSEITEWNITPTIQMTYYDDGNVERLSSNKNYKVQPLSNTKQVDNANTRYSGGTIVISGEGALPDVFDEVNDDIFTDSTIYYLLGSISINDIQTDENDNVIFKYNPKKIIIEEGITSIGIGSFIWTQVEEVEMADSVKEVKGDMYSGAFFGCKNLRKVSMPGVERIGKDAFREDAQLKEVFMPSIEEITEWAFYECSSLKNIYFPSSLISVGQAAFDYIDNDAVAYCETQRVSDVVASMKNSYNRPRNLRTIIDASKFN